MNKNTKTVLTLLAIGLVFSCKEASERTEASADYAAETTTDSTSVISSSAAVENKNSDRKFVRLRRWYCSNVGEYVAAVS